MESRCRGTSIPLSTHFERFHCECIFFFFKRFIFIMFLLERRIYREERLEEDLPSNDSLPK